MRTRRTEEGNSPAIRQNWPRLSTKSAPPFLEANSNGTPADDARQMTPQSDPRPPLVPPKLPSHDSPWRKEASADRLPRCRDHQTNSWITFSIFAWQLVLE